MHKLCLLSLLLAAVAMTTGSRAGARTVPFSSRMGQMNQFQFPMAVSDSFDYNYIQPLPIFNYPGAVRSRMPMGSRFGRMIPDGDYRTAHGIATVDGTDISMDTW
ncbi:hypothetical protein ElyMa_000038300 [Elysia marginata]|uniref:Uncharacterized protein n=1 Tax=Elysia marginata TaxID=1093978 RepID=A0AAV4ECI3_9GAST|nr:hypothetical protein ElyMa_000038300 [Elysia marginata]